MIESKDVKRNLRAVVSGVCIMINKSCPNCKKAVPTSWYVLGDRGSYRCVNCRALLEWKKARHIIPGITLLIFAFLLFFKNDLGLNVTWLFGVFLALNFLVRYFIPVEYIVTAAEDKTRKVLEALDAYGDDGCGVISLSIETGISQDSIRQVFKNHERYFVPLNGISTFKLNKLTIENGSVDKIILSIEQQKSEGRVFNPFFWGLMTGVFMGL